MSGTHAISWELLSVLPSPGTKLEKFQQLNIGRAASGPSTVGMMLWVILPGEGP